MALALHSSCVVEVLTSTQELLGHVTGTLKWCTALHHNVEIIHSGVVDNCFVGLINSSEMVWAAQTRHKRRCFLH
jgi:hypothetical protein